MKSHVLDPLLLDIDNTRIVLISNDFSKRLTGKVFIKGIDYEPDPTEELWGIIEDMCDDT